MEAPTDLPQPPAVEIPSEAPPSKTEQIAPAPPSRASRRARRAAGCLGRVFWQGKLGPAFWTIASLISLTVNVILVVVLLLLARELFGLKALVNDQLLGGLYSNFAKMDQARIATTVKVNDRIPVVFDLPLKTETTVVLTRDTRIKGATVSLTTGGLSITSAPTNIILPAGTDLPVVLDLVVPVNTTIPVELTVPVDIPLNQTELHEPFVGLQTVVLPYNELLAQTPNSWAETPLCQWGLDWLCNWLTGATP